MVLYGLHAESDRSLKRTVKEEAGLLSGGAQGSSTKYDQGFFEGPTQWSRKISTAASVFIALLITAAFTKTMCSSSRRGAQEERDLAAHNQWYLGSGNTRSNGTNEFKRTVILVSIDGFRAEYLDRHLTPHLLELSKNGLRAKSMQPVFPTLTFPNHWTLMTGLYAESHGIVANNFWDPVSQEEFQFTRQETAWKPKWWLGEPMWETAEKAGVLTANLMWAGPPQTTSGAKPTYFIGWRDDFPLKDKCNQIMSWIDLPETDRPQLIMVYDPSLDHAGHEKGPGSAPVNDVLGQIDGFAKDIQASLATRNLTDIVDVIFVSDHGMADTSHSILVYIDDIIGQEGFDQVEHEDGWPSMGLRFREGANVTHYLRLLEEAADKDQGQKFNVYTHDNMPERWHYSQSVRIAPIYVVPQIGYALTTRKKGDAGMLKGNHGFDNEEEAMQAIFIAHGPFSTDMKALHATGKRPHNDWHLTGNREYVMERFQNVEIYNLVMKLLGIEEWAARTNGTVGFWDKYL